KAEICRAMGAEAIIDRSAEDYRFWKDENTQDPAARLGLYAAGPRQERAPPAGRYDPRHTRGPPSTRSS
ncbi:hypothetical protein AB0E96_12725, partial [Kitasatospora sp. NPDC036755]|uniref:hypothetical protein n=1 Tax=Kitasatospora sp. NPDC036755 TaxID=3154600 RepID=UPI0033D47C5F